MLFLSKFLYRHMKGFRLLVLLALLVVFAQVGTDLLAALPLKFIPSKISNRAADPACTFPFLNGVLDVFNTPLLDPSLQPATPGAAPQKPPVSVCPPSSSTSGGTPLVTQHSVNGVIVFSLLMLAVFGALGALLMHVQIYLSAYIAHHLSAQLRERLFDHLQRLSLDWHNKQKKGDLVQRVTGNIADIEKLVHDGLVDLLAGILTLTGVMVIMFVVSREYTLLSLAVAPLLFLIVSGYTRKIKATSRKKSKAAGKIGDIATEDLNALSVIRAFTLEKRENMRFGQHVAIHRAQSLYAARMQSQYSPLVTVLVTIGAIIVLGVGGYVAAGNSFRLGSFVIPAATIDIGTLILFLTYLKMLYQPMKDISKLTTVATNAAAGAERIEEVLRQEPEEVETDVHYAGPQRLQGEITLNEVGFGYQKDQPPVIKGISLSIPAGRKFALVGFSGAGKTTLARLIPRFYELDEGTILIDDVDIRHYPLHVLRKNISMVLQESVLFEGTVRENLAIARPDAPLEEIMVAAMRANIHDTIMKLPDGYNTIVREQGNNFSAGQRQRLSIARAILHDAPILLLDEPTANLDVEAEAEVMHALSTLMNGRTVLTISHRLSTLGQVDEILVMQDGQIVEQGTFGDLKRRRGLFSRLLKEQNRYNLDQQEEQQDLPAKQKVAVPITPFISHSA